MNTNAKLEFELTEAKEMMILILVRPEEKCMSKEMAIFQLSTHSHTFPQRTAHSTQHTAH